MYYTYMLRCEDNSIYTGITNDIDRRVKEHLSKDKKCAKYTYTHNVIKLEALWESIDKSKASKLEYAIKHNLKKEEKEDLIKSNKFLKEYLSEKIDCKDYKRKRKI